MKLSIITPSFNQGAFIRLTLDRVLECQDYKNFEHLVIDGGSTDETINILSEYKGRFPSQFSFISEKDSGQSNAINKGFMKATGDIIGWINSDDYYEPNIFKFVIEYFKSNPAVDMIYGICHIVNHSNDFIMDCEQGHAFKKCKIDFKSFQYRNLMDVSAVLIPQPAVFFRKTIFEKVGYLDESYNFVMDYEYWLRIGKVCIIKRIEKHLANFRTHKDAKTTFRNTFRYISESHRARRSNGGRLLSRFYLYVGYVGIKSAGRMILSKFGLLKKKETLG